MHYPTMNMPWRHSWRDSETDSWMALTWALLAFVGGAMFGMMAGKKKMMSHEMMGSWGMSGRMPMWKHHHHDFGGLACRAKHEMMQPVAPGATGERSEERNEGE